VRELAREELEHPGALHEAHVSDPALAVAGDAPVLAWARGEAGAASVWLRPAGGGDPVRVDPPDVAAAPAHHPPGLAAAPGGAVHVTWAARRAEPAPAADLRLSLSRDGGRSFGAPLRLHADRPALRSFEGLAVADDGAAVVAWIDGRAGDAAPATVAARVRDGRVETETRLAGDTCPCCRTAVAAAPGGGVAAAWRQTFPGSVRDFVWARSPDAGRRWSAPARVHEDGWALDACPHRGGALALLADGTAALAWYTEGTTGRPLLLFARAGADGRFGAPVSLHDDPATAPDRVALALAPDGRGVVVWEAFTAARRTIVARATRDGGRRFGPPIALSRAVKAAGPAAAVAADGSVWAAWNEERYPALRTVLVRLAVDEGAQRIGTSKERSG
jgi:hypothetical protein